MYLVPKIAFMVENHHSSQHLMVYSKAVVLKLWHMYRWWYLALLRWYLWSSAINLIHETSQFVSGYSLKLGVCTFKELALHDIPPNLIEITLHTIW